MRRPEPIDDPRASRRRLFGPRNFELQDETGSQVSLHRWTDAVEDRAASLLAAAGLDPDSAYFLRVALHEALLNAIRHGVSSDGGHRVKVTLRTIRGPILVITVRDEGLGFDPARLPDPLSGDRLRRGSGRGIFYMRRFADRVTFSFPKGGGTLVRLEERLPRQTAAHALEARPATARPGAPGGRLRQGPAIASREKPPVDARSRRRTRRSR